MRGQARGALLWGLLLLLAWPGDDVTSQLRGPGRHPRPVSSAPGTPAILVRNARKPRPTPTPIPSATVTPAPANLLFKSGYESGVTLSAPVSSGSIFQQNWSGSDISGFNWPMSLTGWGGSTIVQEISGATSSFDVHIDSTFSHSGSRSLYQKLIVDRGGDQIPLYYTPDHEGSSSLYFKEWVFLPSNTGTVIGANQWRAIFEWKTGQNLDQPTAQGDFRFKLVLQNDANSVPHWDAAYDNEANGGRPPSGTLDAYWEAAGGNVPLGSWFPLEVYWHRANDSSARIWVRVNGNVEFDHFGGGTANGNTVAGNIGFNNAPINRVMVAQVYAANMAPEQWTDDLEVWSGFPPSSPLASSILRR